MAGAESVIWLLGSHTEIYFECLQACHWQSDETRSNQPNTF